MEDKALEDGINKVKKDGIGFLKNIIDFIKDFWIFMAGSILLLIDLTTIGFIVIGVGVVIECLRYYGKK